MLREQVAKEILLPVIEALDIGENDAYHSLKLISAATQVSETFKKQVARQTNLVDKIC